MAATQSKEVHIEIHQIQIGELQVNIVGTQPLIMNRMATKAMRELLAPRGKKTIAEKASTMKHHPLLEWKASPHTVRGDTSPTYLAGKASWFKNGMMTAALDLPGAKKAQIGRLVHVTGDDVPLWGVPQMHMSVVRSADINKTPDIRTRVIVPKWATSFVVQFNHPLLRQQDIMNLLYAAGISSGAGEWRPEKGKGTFGQYRIANEGDIEFDALVASGGRDAQIAGMSEPTFYDQETEDLFTWWKSEVTSRGFDINDPKAEVAFGLAAEDDDVDQQEAA